MTTVVTLANMPSSPTDVAVNFLTQATFAKQKEVVSADGLRLETVYVYATGDPTTPTTATVTIRLDPKTGLTHSTIRLDTIQTVVVDSIETERAPISVTIGLSAPGAMEDTAKVMSMIGSCYALWFDGVTTKVPNTGIIGKINRILPGDLY